MFLMQCYVFTHIYAHQLSVSDIYVYVKYLIQLIYVLRCIALWSLWLKSVFHINFHYTSSNYKYRYLKAGKFTT